MYRYGREEDEVMGVKFSKEMTLCKDQIVPLERSSKTELTPIQVRIYCMHEAVRAGLKQPRTIAGQADQEIGT